MLEALPHMQRYDEEIIVEQVRRPCDGQRGRGAPFARDAVLLEQIRHQSGWPCTAADLRSRRCSSAPASIAIRRWLRVTDKATLEIVEMVLAGAINKGSSAT